MGGVDGEWWAGGGEERGQLMPESRESTFWTLQLDIQISSEHTSDE